MKNRMCRKVLFFLAGYMVFCVGYANSQDRKSLDADIKTGVDLLKKADFKAARERFESALAAESKDAQPSVWLFTQLSVPDEDPSDSKPDDPQLRQIMGYRHSMATKQALFMFLTFTCQLQGDGQQANKYLDAVYGMQNPLWRLSWRTYIPPITGFFYAAVKPDRSANFGRYLYLAGLLLEDAEREIAEKFFSRAQELVPNDAEINANLASYYVVRLRSVEAKKFAERSLSIKPKQARVLIDLASAEWLLNQLDDAVKHCREAIAADPTLPGPHGTLVLIHVARGENEEALKEAEQGVKLSNRHFYFLALQALALESSGKSDFAVKNVRAAWPDKFPDEEQLKKWFLKGKPLELLLTVFKKAKP